MKQTATAKPAGDERSEELITRNKQKVLINEAKWSVVPSSGPAPSATSGKGDGVRSGGKGRVNVETPMAHAATHAHARAHTGRLPSFE